MSNVVVVDDQPILLRLISTMLRKQGHTVSALPGPLEALEVFLPAPALFDLLLTDIDMRPMTGFQLVEKLRGAGFSSPVVFMSGYQTSQEGIGAVFGDALVLDKPFTGSELLACVNSALALDRKSSHDASFPSSPAGRGLAISGSR